MTTPQLKKGESQQHQIRSAKRNKKIALLESQSLRACKLVSSKKTLLPGAKGRATTIKDEIVPLLPDLPSSNDEDLHEERALKLLLSLNQHMKEVHGEIPMDAKVLPTSLAKRTAEKEVKGSFLQVVAAVYAIVVISFQLVLFSFEDVPCVEPIH